MKYFILSPRGGFNDMCNVIWQCYKYCVKYGRILVIDTRYGIEFQDDIKNYLIFSDPTIYMGDMDRLYNQLQNEDGYPSKFYPSLFKDAIGNRVCVYKVGDLKIRVNLSKDYKENVIFHINCGRGNGIEHVFKKLISGFTPIVMNELHNRFNSLPSDYISIHVRNTDYKSNVPYFMKINDVNFRDKDIFIATDDINTINVFKTRYGNSKIRTFSNLSKSEDAEGLHFSVRKNNQMFIVDLICDFVLLCYGKEYYHSNKKSGFSKNVHLFRKDMSGLGVVTGINSKNILYIENEERKYIRLRCVCIGIIMMFIIFLIFKILI